MGRSIREYLLRELGVNESRNLSNVSKYIRANTKMNDKDKCECCICKVRSKQMYPKQKGTEMIYNHHVMKVEYLAILADRYNMCYKVRNNKDDKYRPNDYAYKKGFKPYSPRVAVCDLHHTMFHELVGDNELDKVYDIKLSDAENLVYVFEEFNDELRKSNLPCENDSQDMLGYKMRYQGIWDETIIKSLTRLSYPLKINQLKSISEEYKEFYDEGDFERYQKLLDDIEDMLKEVMEYDERGNVKLPEVDIFSLEELERIEQELSNFTIHEVCLDDYLLPDEDKEIKMIDVKSNEEKEMMYDEISNLIETSIDIDDEELFDEIYDEISNLYEELNDDLDEENEA